MRRPMETILLRQWRETDLNAYAAMNRDADVMRYFPALMSEEESAASLARNRAWIEEHGWGLWMIEVEGEFAGFTGLAVPTFQAPFMPCVEIGWRLRREFWGRGVAHRAASQVLAYGFDTLHLPEIVSFTAEVNARSIRLMERLGFRRDHSSDFDHPKISEGHVLRRHALYRLTVGDYISMRAAES
jgi:RimJ/RimL family protein N-acetyltransferase